jgi:hypothetical protein
MQLWQFTVKGLPVLGVPSEQIITAAGEVWLPKNKIKKNIKVSVTDGYRTFMQGKV